MEINITPTEWIKSAPSRISTYRLGEDPELIHIVELVRKDTYVVFFEDAYEMEPWRNGLKVMSAHEIFTNFNITL